MTTESSIPEHLRYAAGRVSRLDNDAPRFPKTATIPYEDGLALIMRDTTTHGAFQLIATHNYEVEGRVLYVSHHTQVSGAVYHPPHPSVTPEDVLGARYAHDDGEFWHFAHCSPQEQVDFAADVERFASGQFVQDVQRSNAKMAQSLLNSVRATAFAKSTALMDFAVAVGRRAHHVVVSAPLGHFHRDLDRDHRRELTVQAVDRILAEWRQNAVTDAQVRLNLGRVQSEANAVKRRLTSQHDIELRAVHEAAQASVGTDPVGGREYIYAQSADGAAITGAANLPDPAWLFDNFQGSAGVVRGTQTYYDGEQDGTQALPFAVRFSRPIGGTPAAGANIGSVAWEQEEAYRVYEED